MKMGDPASGLVPLGVALEKRSGAASKPLERGARYRTAQEENLPTTPRRLTRQNLFDPMKGEA